MKSKKLIALGVLAAATMGVVSACAPSGDVTITFWHTMAKDRQADWLEPLIKKVEEANPWMKIEHSAKGGYDEIKTAITTAIPAGTNPTMAFAYPDHVADYLKAGLSQDMTEYMSNEEFGFGEDDPLSDIDPIFLKEGAEYVQEGQYSLPFAKSTEAVFFNKTYFDEKGYTVPTVWEDDDDDNTNDMISLARKIKAEEEAILVADGDTDTKIKPIGYDSDANMIISLFDAYGIPYTKTTTDPEENPFLFENDDAIALITKITGWIKEGILTTKGTNGGEYTNVQMTEGSSYMSIGSTGGVKYNVSDATGENKSFVTGVAEIPSVKLEDGTTTKSALSQGPSITFFSNYSEKELEAAFILYRAMTDTLGTVSYASLTGYQPVRLSAYETDIYKNLSDVSLTSPAPGPDNYNANIAYLLAATANMTPNYTKNDNYFISPAFVGSAKARSEMEGVLANVVINGKTPAEALEEAMRNCLFILDN